MAQKKLHKIEFIETEDTNATDLVLGEFRYKWSGTLVDGHKVIVTRHADYDDYVGSRFVATITGNSDPPSNIDIDYTGGAKWTLAAQYRNVYGDLRTLSWDRISDDKYDQRDMVYKGFIVNTKSGPFIRQLHHYDNVQKCYGEVSIPGLAREDLEAVELVALLVLANRMLPNCMAGLAPWTRQLNFRQLSKDPRARTSMPTSPQIGEVTVGKSKYALRGTLANIHTVNVERGYNLDSHFVAESIVARITGYPLRRIFDVGYFGEPNSVTSWTVAAYSAPDEIVQERATWEAMERDALSW
ncbi:hypothetical protein DFH06DRAFT_1336299 [Mycena polygramma]|nr:hypothetical protein DFH06DRAFT_1336299 [Mycena polygramma]